MKTSAGSRPQDLGLCCIQLEPVGTPAKCAVACISLDRSFSVNLSYVLLEKPASVYFDEMLHSVSIVAELVSEYGIRGAAASGFSKLQHSWTCFCV